jgi:hypothetical protein
MFIRKACRLLAVVAPLALGALSGCEKRPDPKEYGEIITEVPERLNRPFPLPQLEEPRDKPKEGAK